MATFPAPDAPIEGLYAEVADEVIWVRVDQVELGVRLRPIHPESADAAAATMQRDGQNDPIHICRLPGATRWTLAGDGGHRLEGARRAGMEFIKAVVFSASREEREMREVQGNLFRRDLDPYERASFVARLVSLHKQRRGIDPNADGRAASVTARWQKVLKDEALDTTDTMSVVYGWGEEVGAAVGLCERTVRRDLLIYRRIPPVLMDRLREAKHSIVSNGTQLRALAKLEPAAQRQVVELLTVSGASLDYGQPISVGEAITHPLGPKPAKVRSADQKRLSTVISTLRRMSAAELRGLFQSPSFHEHAPPEARRLLAPLLREERGEFS